MSAPARELQVAEEQELFLLSQTDSLTGPLNRRALMEELERAIETTTRNRASSAVLLLDRNNFKYVNDTQGHDAGDCVLKQFAAVLCCATHSYDFVARLGGDEFVGWLKNGEKETARCRVVAILASSRMLAEEVHSTLQRNLDCQSGLPFSMLTIRNRHRNLCHALTMQCMTPRITTRKILPLRATNVAVGRKVRNSEE